MTSDRETILVVTPTLGVCPHLDETVSSIASSGARALHVIVAPQGKVEGLAARFPTARVVADKGKEQGLYGALNAALEAFPSGWDWFTYINDDDLLLPGFGALAQRHLRRAQPEAVAYADVEVIREDGRAVSRVTTERSPRWIAALLQQGISPLMQQGMLVQRSTVERLGGFDVRYRLCADLDFWLRAYAAGDSFRHYSLPVARFRLRHGQLSSNTALTIREQDEIVARLLPAALPRLVKVWARWRYRLSNLPRYLARFRSSGFRTSYEILGPESLRTK
jgi:glycosyltransferase involved in cell wall biosynthesis